MTNTNVIPLSGYPRFDDDEMARRARAAVKADKEAVQRVLLKPHAVVDLHQRIHEAAKGAPTPLARARLSGPAGLG